MISGPDRQHAFYRPLWRRILLVAVVAAWPAFELFGSGDLVWIVLSGGMLAYAVWTFLITYRVEEPPDGA